VNELDYLEWVWGGVEELAFLDGVVVNEGYEPIDEILDLWDDPLGYEDLCTQLRVRAGVEAPPWGWSERHAAEPDQTPLFSLLPETCFEVPEREREFATGDGYEDEYDYAEEEEEEEDEWYEPLVRDGARFPSAVTGGARTLRGWVVAWGDRLWRADGARLVEVAELEEPMRVIAADGARVWLANGTAESWSLELETGALKRRSSPVAAGARVRRGPRVLLELPRMGEVRSELDPTGTLVRVRDGYGRGGVFDIETRERVEHVHVCTARWARRGKLRRHLDGAPVRAAFWRRMRSRMRAVMRGGRLASAFVRTPEGVVRATENGLCFHEDGDPEFVLRELAESVSFSPDGREVLLGFGDRLELLDWERREVVARWRCPARVRFMTRFSPRPRQDDYDAHRLYLWRVLTEVNDRAS